MTHNTPNIPARMMVIAPSAFMNSLAIGTSSLGMLFVVKDVYGASPAAVSSIGALWSVSYFVGCIVLCKVAASLRPRTSMMISLASGLTGFVLFLLFPGLVQAFVATATYGFLTAFFWPVVMGWLSKGHDGKELNRSTSLFSVSWSLGGIISSFLGGWLSEMGKFLPLIFTATMYGINLVFIILSHRFVHDDPEIVPEAGAPVKAEDRSTPLRYPAWLGVFMVYMVMGIVFYVFPVFARDELAMSESAIGIALMIRAACMFVGFYLVGRLVFWQFRKRIIPALSVIMMAVLAFMMLAGKPSSYVMAFAILGMLQSVMYNNSLFYGTSGAPDRNKRASIHETVLNLGQVIGSIGGGIVYQAMGMSVVFGSLLVLVLAGTLAQGWMLTRMR